MGAPKRCEPELESVSSGLYGDDVGRMYQQRPGVGVEIAVVAQRPLQLDDDLAVQIHALFGEVELQAPQGRKHGDSAAPGTGDLSAPLTDRADLVEADAPLAGGTLPSAAFGYAAPTLVSD